MPLKLFLAALLLLFAAPAVAQTAPSQPRLPDPKTFVSAADVAALIAKARAVTPVRPLVSQPLVGTGGYRASLDYRAQTTPPSLHDTEAELWVFVQGKGIFTLGGTLTDGKRTDPANWTGTGISGGEKIPVTKGDILIVPAGVAHQVAPDAGQAVVMLTMHMPSP